MGWEIFASLLIRCVVDLIAICCSELESYFRDYISVLFYIQMKPTLN
jgi:hypothetical protein